MKAREGSVLETLRRVRNFMDANGALLEEVNASGARKELDQSVAQLTAHAIDQDAGRLGSKGETAKKQVLVDLLRETHMRAIAAVARARLRDVPEFEHLRLPKSNVSTPRLVAAAGAMAEAAEKHAQVFVEVGLPADFKDRLLAAAAAVTASVDGGAKNRGRRVGATAGLKAEERGGRQLIKVLDCLVVPVLGKNDERLAEWRSLKKVSARTGPAGGSATRTTPPATGSAPATVAA